MAQISSLARKSYVIGSSPGTRSASNKFANQGIKWHFPPPSGPHFGGVWERLIQSCKRALQLELRARTVNDEILITTFKQVEGLLNSRPLTHISVDPDDPIPLIPFHFLTVGPTFPDGEPRVISTRNRWKMTQLITASIWERWMKEYVPNLGAIFASAT